MADTPTRRKPTIQDQISAVNQLAEAENNRIEFRVSRGTLRQETAQWQMDVLAAACATLSFVRQYGDGFRAYIEAQRVFEKERAAEIAALQEQGDSAGKGAA